MVFEKLQFKILRCTEFSGTYIYEPKSALNFQSLFNHLQQLIHQKQKKTDEAAKATMYGEPTDKQGEYVRAHSPLLSISFATCIISSSDGVMSPDRPMISAFTSIAVFKIFSHGVMTPRSMTLKLLQPSTTATMFFPISCTSPLTVAITTVPLYGFYKQV